MLIVMTHEIHRLTHMLCSLSTGFAGMFRSCDARLSNISEKKKKMHDAAFRKKRVVMKVHINIYILR